MTRKNLLWLIPILPVLVILALLLALPAFVASSAHRGRIEALASSLTGRSVHITGKLSLGLLPMPEITATKITITGPDQETITARALTLDFSLPALLRGQLSAQNLTLDSPDINFPWPLPGGAAAITPPSWLAALHAQIANGIIGFGAAHFSSVNADIFTGANGSASISGTGNLAGRALSLSIAFGGAQASTLIPLTLDAATSAYSLHFAGGLNGAGEVHGKLSLAGPNLMGTTNINASGTMVTGENIAFTLDNASIKGAATLDFAHPQLTAELAAQHLDATLLQNALGFASDLPVSLNLTATDLLFRTKNIPALQLTLEQDSTGRRIPSLSVTLPGSTSLNAAINIAASGAISGRASASSAELPDFFTYLGLAPLPGWVSGQLSATLGGNASQLALEHLCGSIGGNAVSGNLILTPHAANGALNFAHLDLLPLLTWLGHGTADYTAEGEITAQTASFGKIPFTHLLLDAALGQASLNIRRLSAGLYGGLASASLTLNPAGQILAARGFAALPSATPLAQLLPANWPVPQALLSPRLNLAVFAQGNPQALATSLVGTLGNFSFTAAPILDLAQQSAAGPFTLRHPSAIDALKIFGLGAPAPQPAPACGATLPTAFSGLDLTRTRLRLDCATLDKNFPAAGLAWPGPGSLSLRADFAASPAQLGLPDFVLSLGALTATGRVLRENGSLTGQIRADLLALPPIPASAQIPWAALTGAALTGAPGKLTLSANQTRYNGNTILGPSLAQLNFGNGKLQLTLPDASLANGALSGSLSFALANNAAPALTAAFTATGLNTALLALPVAFPFTLPTGTLAATANFTATGYSPKIWLATLSGTANLTATNGTLSGFSLANAEAALHTPTRTKALRAALASGITAFTSATATATIDHGNATLTTASLASPQGSATAAGSIDIFDNGLAIRLTLTLPVRPPLAITTAILGPWSTPSQIPRLKPALAWAPK